MTLLTTGTPAAGASTFSFTTAAMNTPLFSPLRAAQATAGSALGSGGCSGGGSSTAPAPGDDVASFLTQGTVSANILSEPDETDALVSTLMSDPEAEGMIEGDELIVGNLTPVRASGTSGSATWANASDATLNWIAGLGELTPGWAAGFGQVDDAQRRLLGIPRSVDQLQASIDSWAGQNNIDLTTYQVEARFGAYGALPIIVGVYTNSPDSGFILVDGVNGNMDGPFASATDINATSLLAGHPTAYVSGTPIVIADPTTGVCTPVAKEWKDTPPSPGIWTPAPGTPTSPGPGLWQPWSCTPVLGGTCKCTSTGEDSDKTTPAPVPARPNVPVKLLCTGCNQPSVGECATPVPATPSTPVPHPVPPAAPQVPVATPGCTCKKQWMY